MVNQGAAVSVCIVNWKLVVSLIVYHCRSFYCFTINAETLSISTYSILVIRLYFLLSGLMTPRWIVITGIMATRLSASLWTKVETVKSMHIWSIGQDGRWPASDPPPSGQRTNVKLINGALSATSVDNSPVWTLGWSVIFNSGWPDHVFISVIADYDPSCVHAGQCGSREVTVGVCRNR